MPTGFFTAPLGELVSGAASGMVGAVIIGVAVGLRVGVGILEELFEEIIPTWKKAVESLYGAIRPNVAILGNLTPHLHAHLIPRFQTPKTIHGIEFIDPNPKGNYAPYPKKELPLEIVLKIKEEIQSKL